MNLIFRMIYVFIISFFRDELPPGKAISTLRMITLPNDLDINLHMNNGRYLTICDLNRIDLFIRTGLAKVMLKNKWSPIVADHTMTYIRPLKLFSKFDVSLSLTHWDEKYFYMTHEFTKGKKIIASGKSKGLVISKNGSIKPADVITAVKEARDLL